MTEAQLGLLGRPGRRALFQSLQLDHFDPSFAAAHLLLGRAYLQKGSHTQAISKLQSPTTLSGDSPIYLAQVGVAYAAAGRTAEALAVIDRLQKVARQR